MKLLKPIGAMLLLSLLAIAPALAADAPDAQASDATATATRLLDYLDAGDFAAAETMFSAQMAAAVPADKLKAVWESLPAQAGEAKGRGEADVQSKDGMALVQIPLHYANAELVAKIAIGGDGKIEGFLIQPAPPPAADAPTATTPDAATPDATATATRLLDHLDADDYAAAEAMFGEKMAAAVPADKLKEMWESLPKLAGAAQGRGEPTSQSKDDFTLVQIPLHYANIGMVAKVAIGTDGKIDGFLIQPAPPPAAAPPAADANFEERDIDVGKGEHALPGTLAMPKGDAPADGFPAVVLVHGSGPQDRDEAIGANRPFLDIARGLAAQGIAVLRYDKRTQARPQDFADGGFLHGKLTIDTETTDDAVAAVQALAATPGIDPKRIFVFGHSQGGMMAPRIAAHAAKAGTPVDGLILLAAPSRKLLDILIEQNRRLAVLDDGHTSEAEAAAIEKLRSQVRAIRAGEDIPAAQLPLGVPASYWRTTDDVDPVAEAQKLPASLPILILQGARDIQVVDADWQGWKAGFHEDPKVTFKLYPKLNHLGIAGEGEGSLAEYNTPGHVDAQLIDDVAAWVRGH